MYYGMNPHFGFFHGQPQGQLNWFGLSNTPAWQNQSHISFENNQIAQLSQQIQQLSQQVAYLTSVVSHYQTLLSSLTNPSQSWNRAWSGLSSGAGFGFTPAPFSSGVPQAGWNTGFSGLGNGPVGMSYEHSPIRIRETESYVCWELPFQNLSLSDVEVEMIGNRIICRTKTPIHPAYRFWNWSLVPQGIQILELPDGRVECCCVVPVAFDSREVEAVFKDGSISIYVPKMQATDKQSVRIGKDSPQFLSGAATSGRKGSSSDLRA